MINKEKIRLLRKRTELEVDQTLLDKLGEGYAINKNLKWATLERNEYHLILDHVEALLIAHEALGYIHSKDFTAGSSRVARTAIEQIDKLVGSKQCEKP